MASISVIVPSLNVAPYIKHCLDSIKNQTFTYFRAWGQRAENSLFIVPKGKYSDEMIEQLRNLNLSDDRILVEGFV